MKAKSGTSALVILTCLAGALPLAGCRSDQEQQAGDTPRPVDVITLERTVPNPALRLTGAAQTWKQENVGFEVGGRVDFVIEQGMLATGPLPEELADSPGGKGTVLARLDETRYQLQLSNAQAQLAAVQAEEAALQEQINRVLPAEKAGALAELERAKRDYERLQKLVQQDAGSEVELYRTKAVFQTAQARVDQIEASIAAQQAQAAALNAQVRQAREGVRKAQEDLDDCTLYAPFNGQVSDVHVIPGGYVKPGEPVVTLIVMDPIKIEVAVSPETDRRLRTGDPVKVFADEHGKTEFGWVYLKDPVADPQTRTFKVTVMLRNYLEPTGTPSEQELKEQLPQGTSLSDLPEIEDVWRFQRRFPNDPDSIVGIEQGCIHQDEQGHFVWHLKGYQAGDRYPSILEIEKSYIQLGPAQLSMLGGLWVVQQVVDTGALTLNDLIARGAPSGLESGDKVFLARRQWVIRPGDMVDVEFLHEQTEPALYVPMQAVLPSESGKGSVFVVEQQQARKIEVLLGRREGELQAIEASQPENQDRIAPGTQLIVHGVQYLIDGEPVRIIEGEGSSL